MDFPEDSNLVETDSADYYDDDADDVDATPLTGGDVGRVVDADSGKIVVHRAEEIAKLQENAIATVSSVLMVPKEMASLLLRHFNWSVSTVEEKWFADEEKVRNAVGLFSNPVVETSEDSVSVCPICFEEFDFNSMAALACGHKFCKFCWKRYISFSINSCPDCLRLRCPDPLCTAAIGDEMIINLVSEEDKVKYQNYLMRSYLENNSEMKWCPNSGCDLAIEIGIRGENYDVTCDCSYSFCWNCLEEIHHPADCDIVTKWKLKNNEESKNVSWILGNTKPCRKCKSRIEKDKGGMCITCNCNHQFCWLCLDPWKVHLEDSGDFYTCNKYEASKKEGKLIEEEKERLMAKRAFERYTHYFERWSANELSKLKSISDLERLKREFALEDVRTIRCFRPEQVDFFVEAWVEIIKCRRILKWSYAYGYYIPEEETTKKQFFEFLQGEAEAGLERLHQCAEEHADELWLYGDFCQFPSKLPRLTRVTRNYFENLVEQLENGLVGVSGGGLKGESNEDDVDMMKEDYWECPKCTLFNSLAVSKCEACGGFDGRDFDISFIPSSARLARKEDKSDDWMIEYWECPRCTMCNPLHKRKCEVCGCSADRFIHDAERPAWEKDDFDAERPDRKKDDSDAARPVTKKDDSDAARPARKKDDFADLKIEKWKCPNCSWFNRLDTRSCEECGLYADRFILTAEMKSM